MATINRGLKKPEDSTVEEPPPHVSYSPVQSGNPLPPTAVVPSTSDADSEGLDGDTQPTESSLATKDPPDKDEVMANDHHSTSSSSRKRESSESQSDSKSTRDSSITNHKPRKSYKSTSRSSRESCESKSRSSRGDHKSSKSDKDRSSKSDKKSSGSKSDSKRRRSDQESDKLLKLQQENEEKQKEIERLKFLKLQRENAEKEREIEELRRQLSQQTSSSQGDASSKRAEKQSKVVTKGVSHGGASSGGEGVKAKLKKLGLSDESDTSEDEKTVEKRILDSVVKKSVQSSSKRKKLTVGGGGAHELSDSESESPPAFDEVPTRSGSSSPNLSDIEREVSNLTTPSKKSVKIDKGTSKAATDNCGDEHNELVAWLENTDKEESESKAKEHEAMRARIAQREVDRATREEARRLEAERRAEADKKWDVGDVPSLETVLSSRTGPGLGDGTGFRANLDLDENTTPANDTLSKLEKELMKVS